MQIKAHGVPLPFQTPHQILSHLSWAHAFVVVYDVTSRTSFTHAKKLLHIIHSCSHTPLHPLRVSSKCPCLASDLLPWDMFHGRSNASVCRNDEAMNGYGLGADARPQLYFSSARTHAVHSNTNYTHAYSCQGAEPTPSSQGHFIPPLPVSTHEKRGHASNEWRPLNPAAPNSHRTRPCCDSSPKCNKHPHQCPCCNTRRPTTNACVSYDGRIFPSHAFCDSSDNTVTDLASCENCDRNEWSVSETVQRTPQRHVRNYDSCEGQDYGYERYGIRSGVHHVSDHTTLPPDCVPASPQRRHTTLLLGNKRDLEHIR